jgi:hypothetical protein
VGSLFKNKRWIYFRLLQLNISCIYVWHSTNHSFDCFECKCSLLCHTVLLVSWHWLVMQLLSQSTSQSTSITSLDSQLKTDFTTPWALMLDMLLQHSGGCLPELIFMALLTLPEVTRCPQLFPPASAKFEDDESHHPGRGLATLLSPQDCLSQVAPRYGANLSWCTTIIFTLGCCWIQQTTLLIWVITLYVPYQDGWSSGDFPLVRVERYNQTLSPSWNPAELARRS